VTYEDSGIVVFILLINHLDITKIV